MKILLIPVVMKAVAILFFSLAITDSKAVESIELNANSSNQQKFDWLRLKSDELLKGQIISMYDQKLEFDSVELGLQKVDWQDVKELSSRNWQSIRMLDGTIAEGYLLVTAGQLSTMKQGKTTYHPLSELIAIASSTDSELNLWSGYADLGLNFRAGNTRQFDYNVALGWQRRSASSRFKVDYLANFSRYEETESKQKIVTEDSNRLTVSYDWFFSKKVYLRALEFEYYEDRFLNIERRLRYGVAMGYKLVDKKSTSWDVNAGPSYQSSQFFQVQEGEQAKEQSFGLLLGTEFSFEISRDVDFDALYSVQFVDKASGDYIHHLKTGVAVALTSDFNLDISFYADRTAKPKADANGNLPKQNDFRLVIGLGYDF